MSVQPLNISTENLLAPTDADGAVIVRGLHANVIVDTINEMIDEYNLTSVNDLSSLKVANYYYRGAGDGAAITFENLKAIINTINDLIVTDGLSVTPISLQLSRRTDYRTADDAFILRGLQVNVLVNAINDIIEDSAVTSSVIGTGLGALTNKWNDGVMSVANGKVYGSPYKATEVIEIDTTTNTVVTFGTLSAATNKWYNIINGPDGLLYGTPTNVSDVLEINPLTKAINVYPGATSPIATAVKWIDIIVAPNGKLYSAPNKAQDILEFDPVTKGIVLFGGFADNVGKWSKMVVGDNGLIYAGPIGAETTILEFDPVTHATNTYDTGVATSANWNHTHYANGKVYLIPLNDPNVYIFDIVTKAFTTLAGYSDTAISKFNHAVTAENGKIYCIPRISPYILVIDPITDTWIKFESPKGSDLTSIMFWNKGVLAGNGKIYGLPAYKNQDALEINPFDNTAKAFKVTDEVVTWYWSYCAVGSNGDVAGIPMNVDSVVKIDVPG